MRLFFKRILALAFLTLFTSVVSAQVTGKFGTYYDQRELLFESLPTATSDIIFLGNSITDGAEWSEIFQNPHCKNRGISGDVIPGVLNRLGTVTKGQPAMIFLMIGTNDMNWGYSNDTIALGVRTIVKRIKTESPKTRIIVQSILPTNDCYGLFTGHTKRWQDVAVINEMLQTMTAEEGVDYLDLYRYFATEEGKMNPTYSNDGLHLNGEGYALWKQIIEEYYKTFPRPVYKNGKVPVWLNLGTGVNVIHCFDQGASPLQYFGVGANIHSGVTVAWNRYLVQAEMRALGNLVFNRNISLSYAFGIDGRAEFLCRCLSYQNNQLHLWFGGALQSYIDIKDYPQLMNASVGYSSFLNLHGTGMIQYDFAPMHDNEYNLFSIYGKISLPLIGMVSRPGFAYMDNYTANINTVNTLLQDYISCPILFPGVSTDIGFMVNLLNSNRIGLSYRWDYLTSRHTGEYRFDHAAHSFNVTFMFNLY